MEYGWNADWMKQWEKSERGELRPGRIVADYGLKYVVLTDQGEMSGEVSGRTKHELMERPAIGDFVVVQQLPGEQRVVIHQVLERRTCIYRMAAGNVPQKQVIAANVDILFIVVALNDDFNVRRVERYLIMAWNSGAVPIVLLSKSDLDENAQQKVALMSSAAPGVPIIKVSALQDQGKEEIEQYLTQGQTIVLTGSSGCGKSTIVNWLSGQVLQKTQEIREDDSKGRHTTTHREMFMLPQGVVVVDTPGMRELKLWEDDGGWGAAFSDIEDIGTACRFTNCRHEGEAGCAVMVAVQEGILDNKRLNNYRKTIRELQYLARKEGRTKRKEESRSSRGNKARLSKQSWISAIDEE